MLAHACHLHKQTPLPGWGWFGEDSLPLTRPPFWKPLHNAHHGPGPSWTPGSTFPGWQRQDRQGPLESLQEGALSLASG